MRMKKDRIVSVRKPGQAGTKKLLEKYGHRLVCVRYIYDRRTLTRTKTIELIEDQRSWVPGKPEVSLEDWVPLTIMPYELELRSLMRRYGAKWNPDSKKWFIKRKFLELLPIGNEHTVKEEPGTYLIQ